MFENEEKDEVMKEGDHINPGIWKEEEDGK